MEVCAERRPWANGRAEVARPAVVREMAVHVGNMRMRAGRCRPMMLPMVHSGLLSE